MQSYIVTYQNMINLVKHSQSPTQRGTEKKVSLHSLLITLGYEPVQNTPCVLC